MKRDEFDVLAFVFMFFVVAVILTGIAVGAYYSRLPPAFSEYQTVASAQQAYERCKANAPEGMDCILIPMMVSNNVAQELGRERR